MQSNKSKSSESNRPAFETKSKYSWYERLITFTIEWTLWTIFSSVKGAFMLLKMALVAIFKSRKSTTTPVAAMAMEGEMGAEPPAEAEPLPSAEDAAAVVASLEVCAEEAAGSVQGADFEAADWTCGLPLQPAVGVIHLRGYTAQCIVKRDLIVNEPRLRAIMKGRRFSLPDALYNPVEGTSSIKDESVELAEALINRIGAEARTTAMRRGRPSNADQSAPQWAPWEEDDEQAAAREAAAAEALALATAQASTNAQAQAQALATLQKTMAREKVNTPVLPKQVEQAVTQRREERQKQAATTIASTANVFQAQAMKGITYVGHIARSGMTKVAPRKGNPYEVFQVVVQLDNGAEMSFRGAEIEREMERLECRDGQRISITPMGQVPISLPGGGEGTKNLFRIETEFANA